MTAPADHPIWLIWSNQRGMWWRPRERGYTQYIEEAGRYTATDAARIVSHATLNGRLNTTMTDPITGREYLRLDEHAVLAPEAVTYREPADA